MREFPKVIQDAMRASGAAATCLPVQIDQGEWEAALFVHVAGPECKADRRFLKTAKAPVPVSIHEELLAHQRAAVALLRLEVGSLSPEPLVFEILLTPGRMTSHFESLKLLAQQPRVCWFFGDTDFRVLQAQEQPLDDSLHQRFDRLCRDAYAHDSVIRMSGRYDAEAAVAEIVGHYEPRRGGGAVARVS